MQRRVLTLTWPVKAVATWCGCFDWFLQSLLCVFFPPGFGVEVWGSGGCFRVCSGGLT